MESAHSDGEFVSTIFLRLKNNGLGPPQTREIVVDNYLVFDHKKIDSLKNISYRQQNSFPFQKES